MGLNLEYSDGQTPLGEDEKEGLLIPTITTRSELDEFEQLNIQESQDWIRKRKFKKKNPYRTICERASSANVFRCMEMGRQISDNE